MAEKFRIAVETVRKVEEFIGGTHRLAITSRSLAEMLGLLEEECREVLETLVAAGSLRKDEALGCPPLYCKD